MYINLRVFSHFTRLKSIIKPKDLIYFCKKNNIAAVGMCDEMSLFGAVDFSVEAVKNGIKPILGCLINVDSIGKLPLYIKNSNGYEWLSYMLTKALEKNENFITIEDLRTQNGIVCLTGQDIINHENILEKIKELHSIFKDDLFVEIQNNSGKNKLLNIATDLNIPIVVTNDVFCLSKEDVEALFVFRAIQDNSKYSEEEMENFSYKNNFFYKESDLNNSLQLLKEGIENTAVIAKKCSFYIEGQKPLIPIYSEGEDTDEHAILRRHATEGLNIRLKNVPISEHEKYWQRLNMELEVLRMKNFSGYFLITADFIKYAKKIGVPVGPGRGSGAGSLVAYSITITNIDPMKYDLIFERFLNPERNSMPDFDIDFCPEGRRKIVEYLIEKYGKYNVSFIVTFGTLQSKGVIRDVCRIFSISFSESDLITKLIPYDQVNPMTLTQAIEQSPQLKAYYENVRYKKIFEICLKLEGLVRNFSKHAAGVIIYPKPIYISCPLWADEKGDFVTQFDLKNSEYVGCVKFDFLGLRTLTVIKKTCGLIKKIYNIDIDIDHIPLQDSITFQLIKNVDLDGVFQFDGVGIRGIIQDLKPTSFEDLIAINALYRPGPIGQIPRYIARKHGQENIEYIHPMVKNILSNTLGIIVYQEQVMAIAMVCGGYSAGEADLLRRAMGKKKPEEMKMQREIFVNGCLKNNIDEKIANTMFDQMNEFAGYGFNKSHAAPYALIAYICAYLKAHYTIEFIAIFMSEEMDNLDKVIRFLNNLRKRNIKIISPCVQKSYSYFRAQDNTIIYGLGALKNVGVEAAQAIEKERKQNGVYLDVYDFVSRNINFLNKKNWESLVKSGALDCFCYSREVLLENFLSIQKQEILFLGVEKWSFMQKYNEERVAYGFHFNGYLKKVRDSLETMECYRIKDLHTKNIPLKQKQAICYIAGEIISVRRRRNSQKANYAFLEVLDETELIGLTFFSNVLEKLSTQLTEGNVLVFKVKVEKTNNLLKCVCMDAFALDEMLKNSHEINMVIHNRDSMQNLKNIIDTTPKGNTKINLFVDNKKLDTNISIEDSINFRTLLEAEGF
jgi:DNA polymerase-3 subunit alpha